MSEWKMAPVEPTAEMARAGLATNGVFPIYEAMLAAAPAPVFDEAAERAAFEEWADRYFASADFRKLPNDLYMQKWMRDAYAGYLACAKRKAGVQ